MKLFKHKINILSFLLLSFIIISCENKVDDDSIPINLEARFISTINSRTITFVNASNDAESYSWDFNNGMTSNLVDPIETFDNGTYTVVLTAFDKNGNSDTFEQTFIIDLPVCEEEIAENTDPADGDINWTFLSTDAFDAFGNTGGGIVDNPVIDAVNPSCKVQIFEKLNGCFTFAGLGAGFTTPIDFSTTTSKTFTMKVLAETQLTDVTLRLEFMAFPNTEPSQDRVASITQLGEWQELTFDFTDVNSGTFQSMIIYFERNAECDGDIYYFDDIIQQ